MGASEQPSKIGRRLSAAQTQVDQYQHNDKGMRTQHTDTLGRVTKWNYASNGIDVLSIQQKNGSYWETLQSFTYDPADPPHVPRTTTDAAGQSTTLAWNNRGQIRTATAPGNAVTTWTYNATSGFLENIDGPLPGTSDRTSFTPDLYGRARTVTKPGAFTLTMDYDALNRPTQVTYPDGTTEQFSYQRSNGTRILDLTHYKDRENRWTFFAYNALRQRVVTIDPLGRTTRLNWCYCGSLQDLYDGEGNHTHWDYDISARLIRKTYADGTEHSYTYDLAGRLETITDWNSQVKIHSYFPDGQLQQITYNGSQIATPNVSFTYDTIDGKLKTMSDGSGLTTYDYHPNDGSTLGAGRLKSIDSPMENDLIEFGYDAQGRLKTRRINGSANTTTIGSSDDLGRVVSLTNPLGTFEHTYDPVNLLPKTVTAPSGLVTTFDYHTAAADLRLKEIQHTLAGGLALSKHGYTYSPDGNINTWEQAAGTGPAQTWSLVYDNADQLEAATLGSTTPSVLAQHAWRYDKAGNRISRQQGAQITQTGANHLNQMTSEQPGGWMRVRGTTDEPAKVRVKSNANAFIPAATSGTGGFSAWVQAVAGNNTLTIEAEDFSPQANRRTATYRVQVNGSNRVPGYDLNGNLIDNGAGQTYEWDAENRLVKITYADRTSTEFRYDGQSRRVGITEKDAARVVTSEKRYLWAEGAQPAEERAADGRTVVKQYHAQGEFLPGAAAPLNKVFYTKDHLGSVRELVDGNGTLQTRYDYDLWGGRTKITGTMESEVGYTGHHHHGKSGLVLTWYRAYDPATGRWLSRDPIGENGGINLYGYVDNSPVNLWDALGLEKVCHYDGRTQGEIVFDGEKFEIERRLLRAAQFLKYFPQGIDLYLVLWGQYYHVEWYTSYICYDSCNPSETWREHRKQTSHHRSIDKTFSFDIDASSELLPTGPPEGGNWGDAL